jgi:hypothetical protein
MHQVLYIHGSDFIMAEVSTEHRVEHRVHEMADYVRALKYPVISTIVIAIILFAISYFGDVLSMLSSTVVAPLVLAIGAWAGYKIVQFKGNYIDVIGAGVIMGIVIAILSIVLFGVVRGLGINAEMSNSVLYLGFTIAGALVGGGFALTK